MRMCSMDGCERKAHARGFCKKHYVRFRKHGDPNVVLASVTPTETISERFWKRVDKSGDCWLWTGSTFPNGYGHFAPAWKRSYMAHRFAYAEVNGAIPGGRQIDHTCHVRGCVNPDHLRLATNKQNNENPSGVRSDNTSGYRGVTLDKRYMFWRAKAQHNGKTHHVPGTFNTPEEAAEAARQLRLSLFTHNDADRKK